jgi:lycopene cyclase domain-containing protein
MPERYLYLIVDLCCVIIPFAAGFHSNTAFNREWRSVLPAILITAALFIIWDSYFTYINVWHFNQKYLTGFHCINLPIEEVAFFLCIPYSCLFVYYCSERYLKRRTSRYANWAATILAVGLSFSAAINIKLLYTSSTFFLAAALLLMLRFAGKHIAGMFFISFTICLLPFVVSNGILTGSWIDEPVVIYNNSYNLKIRLMTIPIEDVFYGMAFQLMNVLLFVLMRSRRKNRVADANTM